MTSASVSIIIISMRRSSLQHGADNEQSKAVAEKVVGYVKEITEQRAAR